MADIFISYSGEDKTNVQLIARMLESRGWTVWWDRHIPIGKTFDSVIEEELQQAGCVLVIWTQRSVASEWVKNEASEAAQLGKLIPVLLEDVKIPLAFKRTETAILTHWQGEEDHPELSLLYAAVEATIKKDKTPQIKLRPPDPKPIVPDPKPVTLKGYIAIAIAGFLVSLLSVYYYLNNIQGKVDEQVDQRIFYMILVLFGIAASALVFGAMNSYATLKGESLNRKLNLAGPVVGVVLTVAGGFMLPKPDASEQTVTIRVFDKNKQPVTDGEVKIYLEEYIRSQSIDKVGQALFTGIPRKSLRKKVRVAITSPGYHLEEFDTIFTKGHTLDLTLHLSDVIIISGQVKRANETHISDVELNVDGTRYVAYSISNGSYQLRLEEYTLGDEITITTSHQGFEDKTRALKIQGPDIKDVDFVLQPVEQ